MSDEATKIILGDTAIAAGGRPGGERRWFGRKRKTQPPPLSHCENCGTILTGKFCAQCGQPAVDYRRSFRHVVVDVLDSFLNWDSKFFATLLHLITRPWKLTNEFLRGHRVRYLNPLRLYLLVSVLFFFVCNYAERHAEAGNPIIFDTGGSGETNAPPREPGPEATPPIDRPGDRDSEEAGPDSEHDTPLIIGDPNRPKTSFELWLNQKIEEKIGRHGDKGKFFLRSLMENLPYMMFACVPLFAFVLKILYLFRRVFYIDHLIYALHIHSFAYMATLIIWGTGLLVAHSLHGILPLVMFILIGTVVVQIFLSIRLVYRQNWFVTVFKFWLGGIAYLIVLALGLAGTLFATLVAP